MLKKREIYFLLLVIACATAVSAVPPYLWYATYSIENYVGNGNVYLGYQWGNLYTCHEDADGFNQAIIACPMPGVSKAYELNRRDAACTAVKWTGYNAEINNTDFVFYAGHGWGRGPFLGGNAGYPITNRTDIRFAGFLKWVQAGACEWFCPPQNDIDQLDEFVRWNDSFKGVHVVMGHRAIDYDSPYSNEMATEFWSRWCTSSQTIWNAWSQAQIMWVYKNGRVSGLAPAQMSATGMRNEMWASAGDGPAPSVAAQLTWTQIGTPMYSNW